jgi:hypothetical protein
MSSTGSSISSQSSDDIMPTPPVTRQGGPPLERIKSEYETSSSRNSIHDDSNYATTVQSGVRDGRMRDTALHRVSQIASGSSSHDPPSIGNFSNRGSLESSTWSEFLRENSTLSADMALANDIETMNTVAADRKRRLTASAQDSGRRRTVSGGFHNRQLSGQSHQLDGPSSPRIPAWPRRADSINRSRLNYVDLTNSPLADTQQLAQVNSVRPPFISTRQYVLPIWQPDSEASECPICKRQFSLLFRRHHCRKCGRVVCNDCSPHRITIPRQFIVHPPDPTAQTQARSSGTRAPAETIDLTEDADRNERSTFTRITTAGSNPALGGGEKVRLCNPCVPDPQPSPNLDPSLSRPTLSSQTRWDTASANILPSEGRSGLHIPPLANMYDAGLPEHGIDLRRQRGRGVMVSYIIIFTLVCLPSLNSSSSRLMILIQSRQVLKGHNLRELHRMVCLTMHPCQTSAGETALRAINHILMKQ